MTDPFLLQFEHQFAQLPECFYTKMPPEGVTNAPWLVHASADAAALVGLGAEALRHPDFAQYFSGKEALVGAQPLAMVYSGHQFGQWAGQLGDGRALLLGQVRNAHGELWDVQLKGAGLTPYSRMGDGRAVLRSCVREYLCSEAMAALGIATSRALSIVATGQPVFRETAEPGAVLTRLARSHIRFGHFEHFYYTKQWGALQQLADHVIGEYFPEHVGDYAAWFAEVVRRTAVMIAQWQAVGFCHGVMNTDNMSILGLTLDYGPFGFMEAFDPAHVCNHSDHTGRYAYDQQPSIGLWNLHALAHALQPLLPWEAAIDLLKNYDTVLSETYQSLMRQKIGLRADDTAHDNVWLGLVELMVVAQSDYTLTFRMLAGVVSRPEAWLALFDAPHSVAATVWLAEYANVVVQDDACIARMNAMNPKYVLRNWVAEVAIRAAEDARDYAPLHAIFHVLQHPYDEHPEQAQFAAPAPREYQDLCVSCSS